MDIRKLKMLIKLVTENDIAELEIKEGEETIRISRQTLSSTLSSAILPSFPMTAIPHTANPASIETHTAAPATHLTPVNLSSSSHVTGHTVHAPMVGTVYLSPSPDTPPFVKRGQAIQKGETICIIEAMKMFSEIEADNSGIIKECLVENGQPVEFGQPLFIIGDANE